MTIPIAAGPERNSLAGRALRALGRRRNGGWFHARWVGPKAGGELTRKLCLLAALAVLAAALALEDMAGSLFSGHMAQHMLLMDAAAPLLLLALPPDVLDRWTPTRLGLSLPVAAAILHGAVMWGWHAPPALTAAITHPALRAAMLASFGATGLLFWASVLLSGRRDGMGYGAGLFWTFMTLMHVGLLAALLTFAPMPLYPVCGAAALFGLSPLEDQQLAGLILWVPVGGVFLLAGVLLAAAWLRDLEHRMASGGR